MFAQMAHQMMFLPPMFAVPFYNLSARGKKNLRNLIKSSSREDAVQGGLSEIAHVGGAF